MKHLLILLAIALTTTSSFSQKKKAPVKSTKIASATSTAKVDNLTAEIKGKTFQLTIADKGKPVDAMIVKENIEENNKPTDIKLSGFTASGKKLYLLQWTEKTLIKTDLKTENITTIYSVIYELENKKQVFSNFQKTTNIVEKVFLDRNKTASETQERVRREGFEFILSPDGTVTQKSKNQENKWQYDATKIDFVDAKKKK
jgi:replicative DNA helicase